MAKAADKPNTIHQQLIDGILRDYPGAQTKGFMRALRSLPESGYLQSMWSDFPDWWRAVTFIPDAYLFDVEKQEVVVFEAVHSHDVDRAKFAKMAEMGWALDEDYWKIVLIRCDRFSRTRYLPQLASVAHALENPGEPLGMDIVYVNDWHRYTADYCEATLPLIPGIHTPASMMEAVA